MPVNAIDPFGYARSGRPGYPKTIARNPMASRSRSPVTSGRESRHPGFRIRGKTGERFQGFYIYRNDRLCRWGVVGTANPRLQRQLARVVLDDSTAIGKFLTMNPEKQVCGSSPSSGTRWPRGGDRRDDF